jgi:hypothetical protein
VSRVTRCPDCGRETLEGSSPIGFCPFCLLQLGLDSRWEDRSPWLDPGRFSCQVLNVLFVEGGMTSYLAEQEAPARRLVVLTQLDMQFERPEDRCRAEGALGAMVEFEHALVERVFGALVSDSGVVYLVTEHVPGTQLTRYCERVNADTRQRAAFCLSTVDAIRAAHEHGIVHGRLSPSSVIVTTRQGMPVPIVTRLGASLTAREPVQPSTDIAALVEVARALGLEVPAQLRSTAGELADWLRRQACQGS